MNREAWLCAGFTLVQGYLKQCGYEPPPVHVTCGWPSRGGTSEVRRVRGECWRATASKEGKNHIFISPLEDNPTEVLAVLVHEALHAALPEGTGHKAPFAKACKAIGLIGKPTSTSAGPEVAALIEGWREQLGPYPHHGLTEILKEQKGKDGTRMLKIICRGSERVPHEEVILRGAKKAFLDGLPKCWCGAEFEVEEKEAE